jgi:hypothetical protein
VLVMLEFSTLQLKSGLQSEKSACRFAMRKRRLQPLLNLSTEQRLEP